MDVIEALNKVREKATEMQKLVKELAPSFESSDTPDDGISLLHAKYATLMRYNLNLVKLAHARVRGTPISEYAERLVEDWVALNKLRPLEKKLKHQIDALLKRLSKTRSSQDEDDRHRPNPSAFVDEEEDNANGGDGEDGVYRPPRLTEVVYDEGDEKRKERDRKEKEKYQARKIRDEDVREMLAELKGKPEEVRDDERDGTKSQALQRLLREDEERRRYEEENFVRLNVTKKDKKRRREIERALDGPVGDGGDEFAGLAAVADRVLSSKGSKGKLKNRERRREHEEQYKLQQLDEITGQMNGEAQRPSRKSGRKKRRKMRG